MESVYMPVSLKPDQSTAHAVAALSADSSVAKMLIYDSEDRSRATVAECLSKLGYELVMCRSAKDLDVNLRGADTPGFEVVFWGLSVPFENSISELKALRASHADLKVLILAPQEALEFAPAIKSAGIDSIILKPLHAHDLLNGLERLMKKSLPIGKIRVLGSAEQARAPIDDDGRGMGLIGSSPEMKKVFTLIRKVGPSNCSVLITGESGSGKEMVASAIHNVSGRAKKPFVAINCAAIPRELLESELFGHAKGAFTGATTARRGLFEEAHEGTILLDEIGDLPMSLQAKILRLLQTRQVKPLGQNVVKEVDVRIISATHKNLKALIQKGEFREDLYYRLNVMPIHLPALRERQDDIVLLAEYFLRRYSEKNQGRGPTLSQRAASKLLALRWKGNVRELENVIERAIVMSDGVLITDQDILCDEFGSVRVTCEDLFGAGLSLKDLEREYIQYVLSRTGNRKESAIRILGIDRKTLYRKEKLYGIKSVTDFN